MSCCSCLLVCYKLIGRRLLEGQAAAEGHLVLEAASGPLSPVL